MNVIKRDGRIVDYNRAKIVIAIQKANEEVKPKEKITSNASIFLDCESATISALKNETE